MCTQNVYADGAAEPIPSFYQEPGLSRNREYVNQHPNEHIDTFTGKLQLHYVDLFIPGNGGFDLKVQRSYTSIGEAFPAQSTVGTGWTMHFGRLLRSIPALCQLDAPVTANPVLELPDGSRQILYVGLDGGSYITTKFWKGECMAGGMRIYSPDGTRYEMTSPGIVENDANRPVYTYYPSTITDRNGNSMSITYVTTLAGFGVKTVTTSDGRSLEYTYATDGTLSTITDGSRVWTYRFQPSTTLAGQFYMTEVQPPVGAPWKYEYNQALLGNSPGAASIVAVTNPTGGKTTYAYDYVFFSPNHGLPRSTVIVQKKLADDATWSFSYKPATVRLPPDVEEWIEPASNPAQVDQTTVSGPDGTRVYSHIGYESVPPGGVFLIGWLVQVDAGQTETLGYSNELQIISNQPNIRPGDGFTSDQHIYAPLLGTKHVDRDGQSHSTTYSNFDNFGNPGTITEEGTETRVTTATYAVDTIRWIINLKKDETAAITWTSGSTTIGPIGSILRSFDPQGNLIWESRYGVVTQFTYTSAGDLASRIDARDKVTSFSSHMRGIAQREERPDGAVVTRIVSDGGNVTSETDGENATSTFAYDALNRLTAINHPLGNPISIAWTPNTRTVVRGNYTEVTTYDGFGRDVSVKHSDAGTGESITQTSTFDPVGRLVFKSYPNMLTGESFSYDIVGRILKVQHEYSPALGTGGSSKQYSYLADTVSIVNERDKVFRYAYRTFGEPDHRDLVGIAAPGASADISIVRDGLGNPTQVTQGSVTRSYVYDARYYMSSKSEPETGTTVYGRDAVGNMVSRKVGTSDLTNFGYDATNRLTSIAYPSGAAVSREYYKDGKLKSIDNGVAKQSYYYDANKNLKQQTLAIDGLNFTTSYAYNGNDALEALTYGSGKAVTYLPDAFGRPTQAAPYATSVTHHPTGELKSLSYGNGVVTNVALGPRLWPTKLSVTFGTTKFFNTIYDYDEGGNVIDIIDAIDGSYTRYMGYDGLDRLTHANGVWGTGTFAYDGRGNLTNQTLGSFSLTYTYDPLKERLLSTSGSKAYNLSYDVYGNVTGDGTMTYAYDDASNMRCAMCGLANQIVYDYDGANMRVKQQKNGVATYFVYGLDGKLLWEQTAGRGIKEFVYLDGKQIAIREQRAGQ